MLKSAGFTFIAKLLVAVFNFLIVIIISRFLGPAERGICSWYGVVIAVSLVFSEAIAGPTAGFLLFKYPQKLIRNISYAWAVVTSLAITSIFFALGKITGTEWMLLTLLCWLNAVNSLHLHLLLARQKLSLFNGLAVLLPSIVIIFLFLFFLSGHLSALYYLYSLLIAWSFGCLFGILLCRKAGDNNVKDNSIQRLLREGFRYGIINQASHLSGLLNNRLIFFMLPASLLGIYSNALSLAEASAIVPSSMGQVMYASILNKSDFGKAGRLAIVNWWLSFFLLACVLFLVFVVPDSFYLLIFGQDFAGVKSYLVYLCMAFVFYGCYLICSYWQSANGRFIKNFYAMFTGLVVNAGISFFFYLEGDYTIYTGIFALFASFLSIFVVSLFQFGRTNGGLKQVVIIPSKLEIIRLFKK